MRKRDELTNPASCMSRARDDEWTFVLLGRDLAAPVAVRAWISERLRLGKNKHGDAQIVEAIDWIDAVEREHAAAKEAEAARGRLVHFSRDWEVVCGEKRTPRNGHLRWECVTCPACLALRPTPAPESAPPDPRHANKHGGSIGAGFRAPESAPAVVAAILDRFPLKEASRAAGLECPACKGTGARWVDGEWDHSRDCVACCGDGNSPESAPEGRVQA